MPTKPRACAAGDYTCGGLAYGTARYCTEHDPTPERRRKTREFTHAEPDWNLEAAHV